MPDNGFNHYREAIMKTAPNANDSTDQTSLSPLVRLWILRALVNLGAYAKLFPRDNSGLDLDLHNIFLPELDLVHWFEVDVPVSKTP